MEPAESKVISTYSFKAMILEVEPCRVRINLSPTATMWLSIDQNEADALTQGDLVTIKVEIPCQLPSKS